MLETNFTSLELRLKHSLDIYIELRLKNAASTCLELRFFKRGFNFQYK